ncbi:hypothetical protein VM1G_00571 [Cytospora mali]|uniref:Uncharacterized protein n=1 Tax=Cytospora mali TaxID=578113 RepID=A0A194VM93_CYTMA|nr:hypothetical protein VM1G_00571 [Valsa mali]
MATRLPISISIPSSRREGTILSSIARVAKDCFKQLLKLLVNNMSDADEVLDQAVPNGKNQIQFTVENKTEFELVAERCFADWGDFASPPETISPYSSGPGGHVTSSHSPFTGSAGMVGYKINTGSATTWLRFLGSNPYLSAKDNFSTSVILNRDAGIDQGDYNWLYYRKERDDSQSFNGGTLTTSSQIGQADDATAVFTVTFTKDT